jgi:hypothetical protein
MKIEHRYIHSDTDENPVKVEYRFIYTDAEQYQLLQVKALVIQYHQRNCTAESEQQSGKTLRLLRMSGPPRSHVHLHQ